MKEYRLKYSYLAVGDLKGLVDFATKMHTRDFAINYVARLRAEIESLSFLAGVLPESKYRLPKLYHPQARTLAIGKRKLTVIFRRNGQN